MGQNIDGFFECFPLNGKDYAGYNHKLCKVTSTEERIQYAKECASRDLEERIEQNLLILLHDRSPLIQAEAADSLSLYCSEKVYYALMEKSSSRYVLVRAYSFRGLGYVTPEPYQLKAIQFLQKHLIKEKAVFVKIQICLALCSLKVDCLADLTALFNRCGYRNRCAILHGIADLLEENCNLNIDKIQCFLNQCRIAESNVAVLSAKKRLEEVLTNSYF